MFGFGKTKREEKPGQKVPVLSREQILERQLAAMTKKYNELNAQYADLYSLNQSQARRIDELTGAAEIAKAVG